MKNMYEELSEGARKRTVVYDGDFSPDLVSSIMEKSRIATGMSPYLLFSALQSDIPIFHLADSQEANDGQTFIDLGLKDYVMDIRKADQKELLKSLQDIDESYLNALLDINKSNKDMTSELEKSFGEIHRILTKIKPIRKEKKKKKN
jgi:hypothetical protein